MIEYVSMKNMSASQFSQRWNDSIRLVSYCPVCETRYHPTEANILGEDGETKLVHVRCRKCHHTVLALVLLNQVGASSVGLLTDLSFEDVMKFRSNSSVSVDDILCIHTALEDDSWKHMLSIRSRTKVKRTGA